MIRRLAITFGVPAAALLIAASAAAPAAAGSGAGLSGGSASVYLSQFVKLTGTGVGSGSNYTPINVDPPPCLWNPIGDAISGSQYIINFSNGVNPGPGGLYQTGATFTQAQELLKKPVPGTWYELPVNPAASAAGQAECLKLPLFAWVLPGQAPPMPPIPGLTLAQYAYNHLAVTKPVLQANPAGKGYVNLGSYVWNTSQAGPLTVTATLQGTGQYATVRAIPSRLTISTSGPGTAYSNCGATGSHYPVGNVPGSVGPGTPPDCGVLWRGPSTGAVIRGVIVWTVQYTAYDSPGWTRLGAIRMAGAMPAMPINEIQSVNGG
jgi:hypothetical protein